MLRLIKFLFTGDFHLHKWEAIHPEGCLHIEESINTFTCIKTTASWCCYDVKCVHCGEIKRIHAK